MCVLEETKQLAVDADVSPVGFSGAAFTRLHIWGQLFQLRGCFRHHKKQKRVPRNLNSVNHICRIAVITYPGALYQGWGTSGPPEVPKLLLP